MRAESYVYVDEDGKGYVGRTIPGPAIQVTRVAKRGDWVDDDDVKAMGLKDLDDHNTYDEPQTYDYPKMGKDGEVIPRPPEQVAAKEAAAKANAAAMAKANAKAAAEAATAAKTVADEAAAAAKEAAAEGESA